MTVYAFIDTWKATYPIRMLCKTLNVPESAYYLWNSEGRANEARRCAGARELTAQVRAVFDASDRTYGAFKVWDQLRKAGVTVTRRRVAELMRAAGMAGLSGRDPSTTTTRRDRMAAPFPDLVGRKFHPARPDDIWYGDITYLWVENKFWYLATVIDACTKEVVGWAFADHMRTELCIEALRRAIRNRGGKTPKIFHSDRGTQYTSHEYSRFCSDHRIAQSMGRTGVCWDNAGAESFFATLKRELIRRYRFDTAEILGQSLFNWIETWYNRRRTHYTLGLRTPRETYLQLTAKQAA